MVDPFSPSRVERVDAGDVYDTYSRWPSLARLGFETKPDLPRGSFRRVAVLGMGGSAAAGDIIAGWLCRREGLEVSVFNGLVPPVQLQDTLALACSASGGTVETLEMTQEALGRGAAVVAITEGGKLEEFALKKGIPHIRSPSAKAPRYMLPFMLFACIRVVNEACSLSADQEVGAAVVSLERSWTRLSVDTPAGKNPAKGLARRLLGKVPKVYGTRLTRGAGLRFAKALNENAKSEAFFEEVPEALHNDIESWERPTRGFLPVILKHAADDERDSARMQKLGAAMKAKGVPPVVVEGEAGAPLAELVSMVYKLDMATFYLAVAKNVDPLPTRLLTSLRHQIGSS
jgi:glucose/mannose-6-phosphate isomerase